MPQRFPAIVVGAGPAGLAASYELRRVGVEHVVVERGKVAQTWRGRWDSFCLVTPNWTMQLPGGAYEGNDPDGFMLKDEIVEHFERYAASFSAPVREGVAVLSLRPGFVLETVHERMEAETVVVATGAFQRPHRSPGIALPTGLLAIDAEQYTNPGSLPGGAVLVVGSGQTGCQIAEDLNQSGRDVIVACGKAPWIPRRLEGRDIVAWVAETPFLDQTLEDLPNPLARLAANFQATGRGPAHDLHYRTLVADGVTLAGRLAGCDGSSIGFAPDLHESVAWGDARYADVRTLLQKTCEKRGVDPPELPEPQQFKADAPDEVEVNELGAVIFTAGYRPDYRSWIQIPGAFDDFGFPLQRDGASTVAPGLFFMGTHFLRKRKSSTLLGMADDAAIVAAALAARG